MRFLRTCFVSCLSLGCGAALAGLIGAAASMAPNQALADVHVVDPLAEPDTILPDDEAARLRVLLGAEVFGFASELSRNERYVVMLDYRTGEHGFLDRYTGNRVAFADDVTGYQRLTEWRWRGSSAVEAIAFAPDGSLSRIEVDRRTGELEADALALSGFPLSWSPDRNHVVVGELVVPTSRGSSRDVTAPPVVPLRPAGYGLSPAHAFESNRAAVRSVVEIRLSLMDLATGNTHELLTVPENTALGGFAWSNWGTKVAITVGEAPDWRRGGVVTTDSATVQDSQGRLAPEDNPFRKRSAIEAFALHGGNLHRTTVADHVAGVFADVTWDPWGLHLLAQVNHASVLEGREHPTYVNPNRSSYRIYRANGQLVRTIDDERIGSLYGSGTIVSPLMALFHVREGQSASLYSYNLWTGQLARIPTPPGTVEQVVVGQRSQRAVFTFDSYEQPYEVFSANLWSHRIHQVTDFNVDVVAENDVRVDRVAFDLANGVHREGYLISPADAPIDLADQRIVVWQEGGPTAPMLNYWGGRVESPFNLLPNFGISVLAVPAPGRDGYGADFLDGLADARNFGEIDIDEGAEIVEQLFARGYTSPDRVGVAGCSYGGYFASRSITRHPDLFAAANPQCALLDLADEYETGYRGYISYLVGPAFEDEPQAYFEDSPSEFASEVTTPTLIFSGSEDFLPYQFSEDFHDEIVEAGTPAEFYLFAGEGHGLGHPTSQYVAAQQQLAWFREHLGD